MKTSLITPQGQLSIPALNALNQEDLSHWISQRLHGRDRHFVPRLTEGEAWHEVIVDAYAHSETSDDTRRKMRAEMKTIAALLARYPHPDFKAPLAIENYLDLLPDILDDRDHRDVVLPHLQKAAKVLPWVQSGHDLKAACLQCLLDLGLRATPTHWKRLWKKDHPELAGIILAALMREAPQEAFRWFGKVRPWHDNIMLEALDGQWASLLHDFSKKKLEQWIELETMPGLDQEAAVRLHEWLRDEKQFNVRIPWVVSRNLGELLGTCGISVVGDSGTVTVYCDSIGKLDEVKDFADIYEGAKVPKITVLSKEALRPILDDEVRNNPEWRAPSLERLQDPTSLTSQLRDQLKASLSFFN